MANKKNPIQSIEDQLRTQQTTWDETMGETIMAEVNLRFEISFNNDIFHVIKEAEFMELLGFSLPLEIRQAALQKDRVFRDTQQVQNMLKEYNDLLETLSLPELYFFRHHLQEMERNISPGVFRLNWNSLSIGDYCRKCIAVLRNIQALVGLMKHFGTTLEEKLTKIEGYNLFKYVPVEEKPDRLPCKIFFEELHRKRRESVHEMSSIYDTFTPILMKMENQILQTNSGAAPAMKDYYEFWESKVYNTLYKMIISNMNHFHKELQKDQPIFQVDGILAEPEVMLRPTATELYNLFIKTMKDFLGR